MLYDRLHITSQPLTIARSFSYEPDCVIASHMLAMSESKGNKQKTRRKDLGLG